MFVDLFGCCLDFVLTWLTCFGLTLNWLFGRLFICGVAGWFW